MNKIFDYPPYPYLEQIANNCPKATSTYMQLWSIRDKENCITIPRKEIRSTMLMPTVTFYNNLLNICREKLANIDETPNAIKIELVDWDTWDNDKDLEI